jgi:hypothetical protein
MITGASPLFATRPGVALWSFFTNPKNQKTLSWLGGGAVVAAGGIWAVVTYLWPPGNKSGEEAKIVCAQQGSVAAGRDASGNVINFNGGPPMAAAGSPLSCADASKPH